VSIQRLTGLRVSGTQITLQRASSTTHQLIAESAPLTDVVYKHREDWIGALLCAWTAALYNPVQVLGPRASAARHTSGNNHRSSKPEQRR
jgi:hypothetical protein